MALVIAVANQKGGAGKTTSCLSLAAGLEERSYRVLVVDADPQGSALNWRNNSGEENHLGFDVIGIPKPTLHKDLPSILEKSNYEVVLIDCPPGGAGAGKRALGDEITAAALLAAHVVLIPLQPSPMDYQAAAYMLPMLKMTTMYKPDLRIWLMINRRVANNRLGRDAQEAAALFFDDPELQVQVLKSQLGNRSVFAECTAVGKTVLSYDSGSLAALEVRQLTEEVIACLTTNSAPVS